MLKLKDTVFCLAVLLLWRFVWPQLRLMMNSMQQIWCLVVPKPGETPLEQVLLSLSKPESANTLMTCYFSRLVDCCCKMSRMEPTGLQEVEKTSMQITDLSVSLCLEIMDSNLKQVSKAGPLTEPFFSWLLSYASFKMSDSATFCIAFLKCAQMSSCKCGGDYLQVTCILLKPLLYLVPPRKVHLQQSSVVFKQMYLFAVRVTDVQVDLILICKQ